MTITKNYLYEIGYAAGVKHMDEQFETYKNFSAETKLEIFDRTYGDDWYIEMGVGPVIGSAVMDVLYDNYLEDSDDDEHHVNQKEIARDVLSAYRVTLVNAVNA